MLKLLVMLLQVYQVAEQRKIDITELWGADEAAVIFQVLEA